MSDPDLVQEAAPIVLWPNAKRLPGLLEGPCSVELFTEGGSTESASTEIRLESYIFADDEIGRILAEALTRRARQAVCVRFILDPSGKDSSIAGQTVPATHHRWRREGRDGRLHQRQLGAASMN